MAAKFDDAFIKLIRCLYKEYASTIDSFLRDNSLLVNGYNVEDLGDDKELNLYAEFSDENDGELAREAVQTWICDNRLEVTNCIRIALDNKKESFCNWFHASKQHPSPDELLLYCLGKQTHHHVSIFNDKYVWSTLSNHIKYDYFEVLNRSSIALVFLGPRRYGILHKKTPPKVKEDPVTGGKAARSKSRGRGVKQPNSGKTKKKTTCRTSGK